MDFATISQNVNTDEEVVKKYNKCIQNVYLVKGFILLQKMLETSIKKNEHHDKFTCFHTGL